jgi:hypothetical protein
LAHAASLPRYARPATAIFFSRSAQRLRVQQRRPAPRRVSARRPRTRNVLALRHGVAGPRTPPHTAATAGLRLLQPQVGLRDVTTSERDGETPQ